MMKGGGWILEMNVIFLFAILFEGAVGAPERNHHQAQNSGSPLRGKGRYQLGSTSQNCPPCNTKDETTPEPWSLDTGVVPAGIAGNGESRKDRDIWNDIANGGTTGDAIDNANVGGDNGGATGDIANAVDNGGDDAGVGGGTSSNDNDAGWGSNTNDNDAGWGSSNGDTSESNNGGDDGSSTSNDGASNDSNGSSSDNNNGGWGTNDDNTPGANTDGWGSSDLGTSNDNTGGFDSDNNNGGNDGVLEGDNGGNNDNGGEQCTCVPILQCGASFRSADVDASEESPCKNDGEVCCAIPSTGLPPSSTPPPTLPELRCGESRVYKNIDASSKTEQSSEFGEFPWTVLMYSRDQDEENNGRGDYRCAGSLIHPRLVLTAAHCVVKQRQEALVIRAGDWDLLLENRTEPLPSQESDVAQVAVHPLFRPGHPPHDVAIVLLARPFLLADNINTICVPPSDENYDSSKCFSTGWGIDPSGASNNIMKKVQLPIVPRDSCQRALRSTRLGKYFKLDKSFKCAGGTKGKDLCIGDGGGPLSCQLKDSDAYVLVGLTSWGVGCGEEGIPGVFSDVVQANSWILDTKRNLVGDS